MSRAVIVGGSVGGVRTAQALRTDGYGGDIVLVEREDELPYDKPPLSKALLSGASDAESIRLLTRTAAAELGVELVLGATAVGLRREERLLELEGRDPIAYDHLVVATGADARPSPWGTRPGIHVVRTLADARGLRADLDTGGRVVVIGCGFVGAEVAATARGLGLDVTIVDPLPTPMSRALEPEVGRIVLGLHAARGVACRLGVGVRGIDGERGSFAVHLDDGSTLDAATVVVGIGAVPHTGWLEGSGLTIADGVVCDERLRSVDDPAIHAVGDVARWRHPKTAEAVRLEHWTNAVDQAACVAHNIVHPEDPRAYAPVEYVWTDQYDWKIQVVGQTTRTANHVLCGETDTGRFAVVYGDADGTFVGAAVVNWPRALIGSRRALKSPTTLKEAVAGFGTAPAKAPWQRHEKPRANVRPG